MQAWFTVNARKIHMPHAISFGWTALRVHFVSVSSQQLPFGNPNYHSPGWCAFGIIFFFLKWGVIFNDKEISNFIHGQVFFVRQTNTNNVILKNHSTHRCACKIFLVTLCALPHSVGPAVFRRLLVRSPAALCLSVACALLDYVEQMKCVFMLSFRGLGLAPLVAVLTGGMMPPAELYSGA